MISYKTNRIGIAFTLTAVLLTLLGFIAHAKAGYLREGVYFRQTYGYIGVNESEDIVLDLTFYSLGKEDIVYFEDSRLLDFDNELVVIKDIEIRNIEKTKELDVVLLRVTLFMSDYGVTSIERIRQKDINNRPVKTYDIGNIVIENIELKPLMVSYELAKRFFNQSTYSLNINNSLNETYTIKDVIINHEKILYTKEFLPLSIIPGVDTNLTFELNFVDQNMDVIIVKPLIILNKSGDDQIYSLYIMKETRYDNPMSYEQIMTYIETVI